MRKYSIALTHDPKADTHPSCSPDGTRIAFQLIGVQPADLGIGIGMSAVLTPALPQLVERAVTVLRAWELAP